MTIDSTIQEAVHTIVDRLSQRTAILFLGAGVNRGIISVDGDEFPLGDILSRNICRDILKENIDVSLIEAAEIAEHKYGRKELNRYIYDAFSKFKPGDAHLSIVQLPWDIIYTTNFDQLIEFAAQEPSIISAGTIKPICSIQEDLTDSSEEDIIYYKLHGSIEISNLPSGRLTITSEDYKHYEDQRRTLFNRLYKDLLRSTILFIGYSFRDTNFKNLVDDCLSVIGKVNLPRSFAVRPGFSSSEEFYWKDKYNIQLLDIDGTDFLNLLKRQWEDTGSTITPLEERATYEFGLVDSQTKFRKIGDSFFLLEPNNCTGTSDPEIFFKGGEPTWPDIRDGIPPKRDVYWTVLDSIFPELLDSSLPTSAFLLNGAAGTGKTTLLYSLGYDLAKEYGQTVLLHIPGTPLDVSAIGSLLEHEDKKRTVILIRHAADYISEIETLFNELKQRKLRLTLILEERKNQWSYVSQYKTKRINVTDFDLDILSDEEIERILSALKAHKLLGKIATLPISAQIEHFRTTSKQELIVALRELTTDQRFDEIIKDEYDKIPTDIAKRAYIYVSALGQIDQPIRYATILRLLDISSDVLAKEVFTPTEKVLVSGEVIGHSRHNIGYRITTRHPIIASIIFASAAPEDHNKFQILNDIISNLDPGYKDDLHLLNQIVRRRDLLDTLSSHEMRRAIYERLEVVLINNPYVFQHRSILERDLGSADASIEYAQKALYLEPQNSMFLNTLGFAYESAARNERNVTKRNALLNKADELFDKGIILNPTNPFDYIGKNSVFRTRIQYEAETVKKQIMEAEAVTFLEDAYERTDESEIIAPLLSQQWERLGDREAAIELLSQQADEHPTNPRIRDLLITMYVSANNLGEAYNHAIAGIKSNPTSWRLHRQLARIQKMQDPTNSAIKQNYEAAIRHNVGDLRLLIEYGAYLFKSSEYGEANAIFSRATQLNIPSGIKTRIYEHWKDEEDKNIIYTGKIDKVHGPKAWIISIPENFSVFAWKTNPKLDTLKDGDEVSFTIGFNAYGALARIIM